MKSALSRGLALVALLAVSLSTRAEEPRAKENPKGMIGHMVYFSRKDNSADAKEKLVAACKKYLDKHEVTVYFSAGVLAEDFKRDVNDREFDVALHLVFADKAAHDKYAVHDRHKQFIAENKDGWAKVRVFDSEVQAKKK